MKINIEAPWEVNSYTATLITEKLEKLMHYDNRLIHADVYLKKCAPNQIHTILMDVILRLPGPELSAKTKEDTVEKAIAICVEKLRKQIIRRKEKLQAKHSSDKSIERNVFNRNSTY